MKTITEEQLEEDDGEKVVEYLTDKKEAFEGDSYAIINKSKEMKHFGSNFQEFFDKLLSVCGREVIYDETMIDTLINWTTVLASSSFRAFRHTSTFVALQLVDSLISLANKQRSVLESTERQIDSSSSSSHSKNLVEKREKLVENIKALEAMIQSLFNGVVVHRYRDTYPPVRSQCIEGIGRWVVSYPHHFLKNVYTKYIGWTLYDTCPEVRLSALNSLKQIYSNKKFLTHLELFTERFLSRIVESRLDKDPRVAVSSIQLIQLLACEYEKVGEEQVFQVLELVEDEDRTIRLAAANFLANFLFPGGKGKGKSKEKLRELSKFVKDLEGEGDEEEEEGEGKKESGERKKREERSGERTELVVDALFEQVDFLTDWEALSSSLLEEEDSTSQLIFSKTLLASVKRALGMEVAGKLSNKEKHPPKKQQLTNLQQISEHLIKVLPELLNTFKGEPFVKDIVELVGLVDLEVFANESAENSHQQMLNALNQVYLQSSDYSLLSLSSQVWSRFLNSNYPLKDKSSLLFRQLSDKVYSSLSLFDFTVKNSSFFF